MTHEREPFVGSRRQFLKYGAGSALGIGLAATGIPLFRGFASGVVSAAPATTPDLMAIRDAVPVDPAARTLVVLQLGGGNDGLNTVIPYKDPLYAQLRPTIGQAASAVLPISDTLALHPKLERPARHLRPGETRRHLRASSTRRRTSRTSAPARSG